MSGRTLIWAPLIARLCISLFTRTFFQPDEYFQSLEPAHHAVFGYGSLTWEWLAPQPVRSFFFPSFFVPIFYALRILSLEANPILVRFKSWFQLFATLKLLSDLGAQTIGWYTRVNH